MPMSLDAAVTAVRVRQLALNEENVALDVLLREALRMRQALRFYAAEKNYLDGVPMLTNPHTQLLEQDDEGHTAREALRLHDYYGTPLVRMPLPEEGNPS